MKKVTTILMLVVVLLVGGMTAEAKTSSKKKTSSSSSIKFEQLSDGYADIGGHTYSGNLQGVKMTVKFGPYTGSNSEVLIKATYRGQTEQELNNWYYEGNGVIMFYMGGGTPCYYEIRNGGKELYNSEANFTLKVTK